MKELNNELEKFKNEVKNELESLYQAFSELKAEIRRLFLHTVCAVCAYVCKMVVVLDTKYASDFS